MRLIGKIVRWALTALIEWDYRLNWHSDRIKLVIYPKKADHDFVVWMNRYGRET